MLAVATKHVKTMLKSALVPIPSTSLPAVLCDTCSSCPVSHCISQSLFHSHSAWHYVLHWCYAPCQCIKALRHAEPLHGSSLRALAEMWTSSPEAELPAACRSLLEAQTEWCMSGMQARGRLSTSCLVTVAQSMMQPFIPKNP